MASMAQPFPTHPAGLSVHAGNIHGGHPMAPGHPSNQGIPGGAQQPGASMGQQMHAGVTGPGMPQVSQAGPMMAGMSQGGGPGASGANVPSAHALSHLNPGHPQQMFAQQQQQQQQMAQAMANNPHMQQNMAQINQNRQMMFLQQQQQRHLQNGGMGVSPGMNQPQFGGMPTNPNIRPVPLPQHLQEQQQHAQQQQLQSNQHAHQQHQQHQHQLAQQLAMQHAASQAGSSQGQPAPQTQIRPQSQMQGGQDSQAAQHAQRQAQLQQQQQQQAQAQAAQQHQQQQQAQQQQVQQQVQAQAQQVQQAALMQPRLQNPLKGSSVLKLLQFGDHLSQYSVRRQSNDMHYWQNFVERFYSQTGVLRQELCSSDDFSTKEYQISQPTLARYYYTHFSSGVQNIQMILENAREKDLPNGGHYVESVRSCFIYWFSNGCQLVTVGSLRAIFDQNGKIDVLDLVAKEHHEYVPRAQLSSILDFPEQKHPPNASKTTGKRNAQQRQRQQLEIPHEQSLQLSIPKSPINSFGVTSAVLQFLELAENISQMEHLFVFSQQRPHLSASDALSQIVISFQTAPQYPSQPLFNPSLQQQQQQIALNNANANNPNLSFPQDQRTPNLTNGPTNHFASPASAAHLNLPTNTTSASPATLNMSPAMQNHVLQNHMGNAQQQAPTSVGMVAQQSQQGTNTSAGTGSQGTSANTSPNVTQKRRRASAVKVEGDDGGGVDVGLNGTGPKVKASPGNNRKRQKAGG